MPRVLKERRSCVGTYPRASLPKEYRRHKKRYTNFTLVNNYVLIIQKMRIRCLFRKLLVILHGIRFGYL